MATIVVHGTMTWRGAQNYPWWFNSWGDRGFLRGLSEGLVEGGGYHDVWQVGGRNVSEHHRLCSRQLAQHDGHFRWSGANSPQAREAAAGQLVDYLNELVGLTDEPLRIVAHSHGCNVVKMASADRGLSPAVYLTAAVFLACPHFAAETHDGLAFPYRLDPRRFGVILGLACRDDPIQMKAAGGLHGGLEIHGWNVSGIGAKGHAVDLDPNAAHLYESYFLPTDARGKARHSVIHGSLAGYLAGLWLAGRDPFSGGQSVPVIPDWDEGDGRG